MQLYYSTVAIPYLQGTCYIMLSNNRLQQRVGGYRRIGRLSSRIRFRCSFFSHYNSFRVIIIKFILLFQFLILSRIVSSTIFNGLTYIRAELLCSRKLVSIFVKINHL